MAAENDTNFGGHSVYEYEYGESLARVSALVYLLVHANPLRPPLQVSHKRVR